MANVNVGIGNRGLRAALGAFVLIGTAASAGDATTVNGSGTAETKQLADLVRVSVQVRAEGKDVREAVAKLKDRQATVRGLLQKLKADSASIKFGAVGEIVPN